MSDMTFPGHTLACDWPECEETAHDGHYSGWESYDSAVMAFADPDKAANGCTRTDTTTAPNTGTWTGVPAGSRTRYGRFKTF